MAILAAVAEMQLGMRNGSFECAVVTGGLAVAWSRSVPQCSIQFARGRPDHPYVPPACERGGVTLFLVMPSQWISER